MSRFQTLKDTVSIVDMSDNAQIEKAMPSPKSEADRWLENLEGRIDAVRELPNSNVLVKGIVLQLITGDASNGVAAFVQRATMLDSGLTSEYYDKALEGFNTTWQEVHGAVQKFKDNLGDKANEYFEKEIFEKFEPLHQELNDPSLDKNSLDSIFKTRGKDFLSKIRDVQKIFGDEISAAREHPNFEKNMFY